MTRKGPNWELHEDTKGRPDPGWGLDQRPRDRTELKPRSVVASGPAMGAGPLAVRTGAARS
ncbi:hypothetical protein GCM10018987_17630 [Streptomyces cremeus]